MGWQCADACCSRIHQSPVPSVRYRAIKQRLLPHPCSNQATRAALCLHLARLLLTTFSIPHSLAEVLKYSVLLDPFAPRGSWNGHASRRVPAICLACAAHVTLAAPDVCCL